MAQLPQFQSSDKDFQLMQSKWASILNPIIANPITNPLILKDIALAIGSNIINHKLGRKQQGWVITDLTGAATVYRSQPFNDLTLTLTSDAAVTVTLAVY